MVKRKNKFKSMISFSVSQRNYGRVTISGLMADLLKSYAEIGWGNLFVTLKRLPYIDYTDWYYLESNCVLVPRPQPYSKILALVQPFDFKTWTMMVVTTIVAFVVLQLQGNNSMFVLALLVNQSHTKFTTFTDMKKRWSILCKSGIFLIFLHFS